MYKILQERPTMPTERPAPKKRPADAAPPFTPSPKPRQAPPAPSALAVQTRQQCAKTVRQARAALLVVFNERQAAPPERSYLSPPPGLDDQPHAFPRSDCGLGAFGGQFAGEYDWAHDGMTPRACGAAQQEINAAALEQELDCAALARLLPCGLNDGIFDVVLPTGERLGVVVNGQSSSLSYLLSPSPDQFGSRLRRQRMELEERMERLTHRNVRITVL